MKIVLSISTLITTTFVSAVHTKVDLTVTQKNVVQNADKVGIFLNNVEPNQTEPNHTKRLTCPPVTQATATAG